jgi:hypothetical protein
MKYQEDALWQALAAMRIEAEGAPTTFTDKLAREQGWSRARAAAVAAEYRRFLYLAATAERPVTPSDAVDRAWHLHLTYSRHYWDVLCGQILGKPLHHDPGDGSAADDAVHRDQYLATLDTYARAFGEMPPADVWPGPPAARDPLTPAGRLARFAKAGAAAAACTLLAACAAIADATGESEGNVLIGFFVFGGIAAVVGFIFWAAHDSSSPGGGRKGDRTGGDGCGSSCGSSGSSCGSSQSDSSGSGSSSDGGGSSCGGGGCGGGGGGD